MRNIVIALLSIGCLVMLYFTLQAASNLAASDTPEPSIRTTAMADSDKLRLVVITQELDTPFWLKFKQGADASAAANGASLEMWGTYSSDRIEFLKQIEIAIASKVDGIIVQGLDTPEFTNLTKIKAAGSGIPVITVANDVPMQDSLRRTYVGSDHFEAGKLIARQLVQKMGTSGKVVLMTSDEEEDYQRQRLKGILQVLAPFPGIETIIVTSGDSREAIVTAIDNVLNKQPDAKAFVAVSAADAAVTIQQIEKRSRVEPYYIYSFDDNPETMTLLKLNKLDALITQSPQAMGELSVKLMVDWLNGKTVPLRPDGYFTGIRVLKAEDAK
ncbi:substrate-binding domain-containing protein [Paenibacillus kobensis]|uniref:substrate-binding domain-containing protein n=1 Tax=Paenibacillus kobensis TaxID=59841 RepID=UPI000FD98BCA|nr:substrate-binding domain-containing protein [Paenibacillus kobensis]